MFKYIKNDKYYQKLLKKTDEITVLSAGYIDEPYIINEKDLNIFLTPLNKLKKVKSKNPIVLLSSGAYNPLHIGHIKMLDLAKEELIKKGFEVIGGYFSFAGNDYVKTKDQNDYEIEKRFIKSIDVLNKSTYLPFLFQSIKFSFDINFTKMINLLELFLKKHYHKNVKVCYVYGSDNTNFGYLFEQNKDLMACCVKRPNYDLKSFKNVINVNIESLNISSTEIRKNMNFEEKHISKIYLKDDGFFSLKNIEIDGYKIFKENLKKVFQKYIQNVELIEHKTFNGKGICSLDEIEKTEYNLNVTRIFELDFLTEKPIRLSNRINTPTISKQLQTIPNEFILFDDDSASGYTIKTIEKILKNKTILEKRFNQKINENEDICDIRDFLIGSNGSGLTIFFKNRKYKLPYIFPFVNIYKRASIPMKDIIDFSKDIIDLNISFYYSKNLKLSEINFNLFLFFKHFGINKDTTMIDFLLYLKTYYYH